MWFLLGSCMFKLSNCIMYMLYKSYSDKYRNRYMLIAYQIKNKE